MFWQIFFCPYYWRLRAMLDCMHAYVCMHLSLWTPVYMWHTMCSSHLEYDYHKCMYKFIHRFITQIETIFLCDVQTIFSSYSDEYTTPNIRFQYANFCEAVSQCSYRFLIVNDVKISVYQIMAKVDAKIVSQVHRINKWILKIDVQWQIGVINKAK